MLSKLNWATLFAVAGGAGIGIGVMIQMIRERRVEAVSKSSFLKAAIKLAKEQKEVVEMFGGPFEIGRIDFGDGWSKIKPDLVQLRLPVKGENDKGSLWAYARKNPEINKFRLFKLEATFDKVKGKKLVLLDLAPGEEYVEPEQEAPPVVEPKSEESEKDKKRRLQQEEMRKKTIDYQKRYLEQAKDKNSTS